jgi:hypothetical protein
MGLLSGSMDTISRRKSNASTSEDGPEGNPNDTSQLDKDEGNILMAIIAQRESSPT